MRDGVLFFDIATAGYAFAFFAFLVGRILKRRSVSALARGILVASFVAQTVGLVLRGLALGGFPVTNTYESVVFYN